MAAASDVTGDSSPISSDTEEDDEATVLPTPPVHITNERLHVDLPKDITFKSIKDGDAKRLGCFESS